MNRTGVIALALVFWFSGAFLSAQEKDTVHHFSVDEAVDHALENNLEQQNARLDIEAARKRVWETTAIGLPQISGTYNHQYIPGEIPSFRPDPNAPAIELAVRSSGTYTATVSQLVFSGEYIVGLQASRTYLQISQLNSEKKELDIKNNVINSYITILILEENARIMDSSIFNLEKTLVETKAMVEQGFMETTDADQMELNIRNLENSLASIRRQVETSYLLLKIQMGMEESTGLVLTQDLDEVKMKYVVLEEDLQPYQVTNTVTYRILENQVDASELSMKREKSAYLPSISAFYQYQDKTNKATFDFTMNHMLGVNVNIPIFSSFQRNARVQQARVELEKTRNNKQLMMDNLQMQAQRARFDYYSAREKYQNARRSAGLSQTILKRTTIKYREGMASSLELTQANNQYLDAQSSLTSALMELLKAKITYDKLLNNL